MENLQPNFEIIKTAFYKAFLNCDKANTAILMQTIRNLDFRSSFTKQREFKDDFNKWLDRLDIRQVGSLILILKEQNKPVPKWAKNWDYNIEYNENGMLDLIRTDNLD